LLFTSVRNSLIHRTELHAKCRLNLTLISFLPSRCAHSTIMPR